MGIGWILVTVGPAIGGPLPGPLGIIAFAAGAALLLQNSQWARREYVKLKRRWPKAGRWMDISLRRGPRPKPPPESVLMAKD